MEPPGHIGECEIVLINGVFAFQGCILEWIHEYICIFQETNGIKRLHI